MQADVSKAHHANEGAQSQRPALLIGQIVVGKPAAHLTALAYR